MPSFPSSRLSPGLLLFLPLFHKQNKNQIKRLNVCREITFREQTQNGGGFGEHELDLTRCHDLRFLIKVPIMDTTKTVLETVFGNNKVTTVAATSSHGNLIKVDMSNGDTPGGSAFLFIMKDGDRLSMLGTESGFVSSLDSLSFKPDDAVNWIATISSDKFVFVTDDGDIES